MPRVQAGAAARQSRVAAWCGRYGGAPACGVLAAAVHSGPRGDDLDGGGGDNADELD